MLNVDVEEVMVPMVAVVELVDGLEVEVEEYQLILWMNHSMLTFRCMPTVCSAQHTFFFLQPSLSLFIQLNLNHHLMVVAEEEEEEVMSVLVKHQLQILNHILQTGDEVIGVSVVEVGDEDILKSILQIDILILGLELLQTFVVVVVVEGFNKDYDQMPL